jgi:hypothetical protein
MRPRQARDTAQLVASHEAVVAPVGMYQRPNLTIARNRAVQDLEKELVRQIDLWSRMSRRGRSSSPATGGHNCNGAIIDSSITVLMAMNVHRRMA